MCINHIIYKKYALISSWVISGQGNFKGKQKWPTMTAVCIPMETVISFMQSPKHLQCCHLWLLSSQQVNLKYSTLKVYLNWIDWSEHSFHIPLQSGKDITSQTRKRVFKSAILLWVRMQHEKLREELGPVSEWSSLEGRYPNHNEAYLIIN